MIQKKKKEENGIEEAEKVQSTPLTQLLDGECVLEDFEKRAILKSSNNQNLKLSDGDGILSFDKIEGICVECIDQPANVHCDQCGDDFCSLCFNVQHRRGKRKHHTTKSILIEPMLLKKFEESVNLLPTEKMNEDTMKKDGEDNNNKQIVEQKKTIADQDDDKMQVDDNVGNENKITQEKKKKGDKVENKETRGGEEEEQKEGGGEDGVADDEREDERSGLLTKNQMKKRKLGEEEQEQVEQNKEKKRNKKTKKEQKELVRKQKALEKEKLLERAGEWFTERAKYIPLRLTYNEERWRR